MHKIFQFVILHILLMNGHTLDNFAAATAWTHLAERSTSHLVVVDLKCLQLMDAREELPLESISQLLNHHVVILLVTLLLLIP